MMGERQMAQDALFCEFSLERRVPADHWVRGLCKLGFIAAGPRSLHPRASNAYVTTPAFLSEFGFETLRDLRDFERLEDDGLLSKDRLLAGEIPTGLVNVGEEGEEMGEPALNNGSGPEERGRG